jgi:hypothetical protein
MSRRSCVCMVCVAVLVGCGGGGGGGGEPEQGKLTINTPEVTTSDATQLVWGSGFVPAGSACRYVDPRPWGPYPYCDCTIGSSASLVWANDANAMTDKGQMTLQATVMGSTGTCFAPEQVMWTAVVPLVLGRNVITITLSDGHTVGTGTLTLTRD